MNEHNRNRKLVEPRRRFEDSAHIMLMEAVATDHTPFNKRPGSVHDSRVNMEIVRCDGTWVQISMEETTQVNAGGPMQSRTISVVWSKEHAERMARFILGANATEGTK